MEAAMPDASLPIFYRKPRPLQAERDADLGVREDGDYGFARQANAVPLVAVEMTLACRHYPIVFAAGAVPQPVALLGLRGGQNLFVDAAGRWSEGVYIPAYVRRYPFIFMENADKSEYTLCIDEAAAAAVRGGGRPLFADGKPTDLAQRVLAFCRDYQANHNATQAFVQAVAAADLLVDNRADVTLGSGERLSLAGFKVIDEARFNALDGEVLLRWRGEGWLALVYAHLISISNWAGLVDRTAPAPRA